MYTIRGTTYLDGKKFEERLKSGVKSQIFVENLDEWFDVETLVRKETAIPHTNVVLKTFNATYSIPDEASGVSKSVTETGLKSDRFRIVADEKDLQGETNEAASIAGVPAAPKVDEYTGVGGWQTVTVREVDEEKEHEEYEKNIEAIRKGEYQVQIKNFFVCCIL